MLNYQILSINYTFTQQKKLKNAVKNKTGTTLRINLKTFNRNILRHELLLTTRQKKRKKKKCF